jgi:hypothetical protein
MLLRSAGLDGNFPAKQGAELSRLRCNKGFEFGVLKLKGTGKREPQIAANPLLYQRFPVSVTNLAARSGDVKHPGARLFL